MPCFCIILTGYPCSGKSSLANEIKERATALLLEEKKKNVQVTIVNERTACPDHATTADCYSSNLVEKKTRAALKAGFDRSVSASSKSNSYSIIILDSMNYIKGFRYELYCISKAARCHHCVVWCMNTFENVKDWNGKSETSKFSDALLQELIMRYEPPDERNRWDKPLYKIKLVKELEDSQVFNQKGVYNMHNLSSAFGGSPNCSQQPSASKAITTESKESETNNGQPKKTSASATFKRANFKRPAKPPSTSTNSSATAVQSLTEEALAAATAAQTLHKTDSDLVTPSPVAKEMAISNSAAKSSSNMASESKTLSEQIDEMLQSFLFHVQALQEGTSTRQHVATDSNVLHAVDSVTQKICTAILTAQQQLQQHKDHLQLVVDGAPSQTCRRPKQKRDFSMDDLRRLRRQYVQWSAKNPPEDVSTNGIAKLFVEYIEAQGL